MLTKKALHECFYYSKGLLYWKKRPLNHFKTLCARNSFNGQFAGEVAGTLTPKGYIRITLFGKGCFAHRAIWVMFNGCINYAIDHIDGNKVNNKINNLRDVNQSNNSKNTKMKSTNTSGITGVTWHKGSSRWISRASINGKRLNIGTFSCFFNACCARKSAEIEFLYHENHGRAS